MSRADYSGRAVYGIKFLRLHNFWDRLRRLVVNPEFPGSISGATRFFRVAVDLERGALSPCEDK
jgi:hypothetical protein